LKIVRALGDFAVRVLEVTEVVDTGIPNDNGDDPPEKNALETLGRLSKNKKNGSNDGELRNGCHLKGLHDATLLAIGPFLETPASTTVVDWNTPGRIDDLSSTAFEGAEHIEELPEVCHFGEWEVTEAWVFELLPREVACELGILVDVVGEGMVLLVHDTFVYTKLEAKNAR